MVGDVVDFLPWNLRVESEGEVISRPSLVLVTLISGRSAFNIDRKRRFFCRLTAYRFLKFGKALVDHA